MSRQRRIMFATFALLAVVSAPCAQATSLGPPRPAAAFGIHRGELRSPIAVAVAGERVYVADFDNDRVQVLSRGGEAILQWGTTGSGAGQFRGPAGVAVGADGAVYVTDLYNHRVQTFTADGEHVATWAAGDDAAPFGIAVDRGGRIHVTDLDAGRVLSWSAEGTPLRPWGTRGHGRGELAEPWGIAVDAAGDVFVADHDNHRVQRFSNEGGWLGAWGEVGVGEGQLLGPMGLAIGRDGSVYLTDLVGDRVRRFTRGGDLLATWRGSAAGAMRESPSPGLSLDAGGEVFLADPMRQEIVRIPGAFTTAAEATPTSFALLPISHALGAGPFMLEMAIPTNGRLSAEIFSLDGRRVHTVPSAACDPGLQRITWDADTDDGRRAPAGMYFVRVHFEDGVTRMARNGRIVVLR